MRPDAKRWTVLRWAAFALLAAAASLHAGPGATAPDELAEARRLAPKYNAVAEHHNWDQTRVDLLSDQYAIEIDWAHKWAEAIGQSLYYAELTGRKPAIILLVRDMDAERQYVYRCQTVCAKHGIKLFVEKASD